MWHRSQIFIYTQRYPISGTEYILTLRMLPFRSPTQSTGMLPPTHAPKRPWVPISDPVALTLSDHAFFCFSDPQNPLSEKAAPNGRL